MDETNNETDYLTDNSCLERIRKEGLSADVAYWERKHKLTLLGRGDAYRIRPLKAVKFKGGKPTHYEPMSLEEIQGELADARARLDEA